MDTEVVLLTGGSMGIGLEMVKLLLAKGVKVYSVSRRLPGIDLEMYADGKLIPLRGDVNNEAEMQSLVERIVREEGKLDAVVCNAGNGIAGSVEDTSVEEAKYQFETNFFGVLKTIQACLPVFREQGYGKIMATSSMGALVPIPFQSFYSSVKSALLTFMQALSIEVKPFGIQCCTVLPGNAKTGFTSARKFTERCLSKESVYSERMNASVKNMEHDEEHGMKASFVAKKMVAQLMKKRMKEVLIPGLPYKLAYSIVNVAPVKLRLWAVARIY